MTNFNGYLTSSEIAELLGFEGSYVAFLCTVPRDFKTIYFKEHATYTKEGLTCLIQELQLLLQHMKPTT